MTDREKLDTFLADKRIAMVGLSRNESSFSYHIFEEFNKHGYEIVPVNPTAKEIAGKTSYGSVKDINPNVETVFIISKKNVNTAIQECLDSNVKNIWVQNTIKVSPELKEACEKKNVRLLTGYCPFMFLPNPAGIHKIHAFFKKLFGSYPK